MFLLLWNYLRGYVTVEIRGYSVERFLNLAARRGIYIWDAAQTERGVEMNVSIKAFKLLKYCARKSNCKIKIKHKNGYPFVAHRYRKRKILAGGIMFFICSLVALSSFVWLIEVKGNERVGMEDIISLCSEEGLRVGSFKYSVNSKEFEKKLLERFPDISWVDVHIKGTRVEINLTEIIPKRIVIDNSVPCDIVAKKDGLVTSVAASAGTPKIRQMDVVKKGDLLVSGEVNAIYDGAVMYTEYVHATAEVLAKAYYVINMNIPFVYEEKKYTDNSEKKYSLKIFGYDIKLYRTGNSFESYDKITVMKQLRMGEDYPLPVLLIIDEYKEFVLEQKSRDAEQAKNLADRMVTGRIIREFDIESDIINKTFEYNENADSLDIRAIITTEENIGEVRIK